jgi:hypothetical protein
MFKDLRHYLGRHSVAVFGMAANGPTWGTGILVDFRDTPLVLTCAHVVVPIVGTAFVTTGRFSYQEIPLYDRLLVDPSLDVGCLVLRERTILGPEKRFIRAADAVLEDIDVDRGVTVYGFPTGNPRLQIGGEIDPGASTARFRSMTVPSVTAVSADNPAFGGRRQSRVECSDLIDLKTFQPLRVKFTARERGGFSGGPVILTGTRRLVGQITHASDYTLWYNPIYEVFRTLDRLL